MLDMARARPGCEQVHWIHGSATDLGPLEADLAIMSGHVAQFFLTDEAWEAALLSLHGALRPGGHLAFESRNPGAREWERWTRDRRTTADDPLAGRIEAWSEVQDVTDGIVSYTIHYRFFSSGDELTAPMKLRFRTREALAQSLSDAGFLVQELYGDWDRRPTSAATRELIFVAVR